MNSVFVQNTILPFAFYSCFILIMALVYARRNTRNVSAATGSWRWVTQIVLLVVFIVVMIVLSNYIHDHPIRASI
jgi:hypothetical protein